MLNLKLAGAGMIALALPTVAGATTVGFTGTVVNLCVLTVTTPGVLAPASSGTSLSSEETGGANANLTVVATGTQPTITFSAPDLSGPAASSAGATKQIAFTSAGGANQGYVSNLTSYVLSRLTDTFVVKGRVANPDGFVSGAYLLSSTVTCQQ